MRKEIIRVIVLFVFCMSGMVCNSQAPQVLLDAGIRDVYSADTLHVFGFDFSTLKLANKDKLKDGPEIKETCVPIWCYNFERVFSKRKLSSYIKKQVLVYKVSEFQVEQRAKLDENNLVVVEHDIMGIEKVEEVVRAYSLGAYKGVGMSFIVEELHKKAEEVSVLFVFFNIETKEPLYVFRGFGTASGMGMRNHWENGLHEPINSYLTYRYKKEWKKNRRN